MRCCTGRIRIILSLIFFTFLQFGVTATETLHSPVSTYYNDLELQGTTSRTQMNYSSLSLNEWETASDNHPWRSRLEERRTLFNLFSGSAVLIGPQVYQSWNQAAPYGGNDGSLWQGKGYNTQISTGIRYDSEYIDIILMPEFCFSQNRDYGILPDSGWSGSEYGYYNHSIDLPQRFGDSAFTSFDTGESHIRLTYGMFTAGMGTESVWIGPGKRNAIIWSDNAEGIPHIDLGIQDWKTRLGRFESFLWWGVLKSSDYMVIKPDSYRDFLAGFSFSYSPAPVPGLTLGFHKTAQTPLDNFSAYSLYSAVDLGITNAMYNFGDDEYDGRASVSFDWTFPEVGFQIYGEWAREDYSSGLSGWFRTPEHTAGYTLGFSQHIGNNKEESFITVTAELSSLVWSMDYFIGNGWGGGYYRHHITKLGYANEGQCLGASFGSGGNSLYLEVDYTADFGRAGFFISRVKHDDSSLYLNIAERNEFRIPHQISCGPVFDLFLPENVMLSGTAAYVGEFNWNMVEGNDLHGFHLGLWAEYSY